MDDLILNKTCRRGDTGRRVRIIQEWLCLHGNHVVIDGAFGPATEAAVRQFQTGAGLLSDGRVTRRTYASLIEPMIFALEPLSSDGRSLGDMIAAYANRHLQAHPREVGGDNRGPWVRLYLNGVDGPRWPWCAAFACFVLHQACTALGLPLPIPLSASCDKLAADARAGKLLYDESMAARDKTRISPGSLFLLRKTPSDWQHAGIVTSAADEYFCTIEGNTNDEGSREGYEVCARTRGYTRMDFIVF
jgi:peptidoglycan hydrolase-like protein with peptidoglycan-binding domain